MAFWNFRVYQTLVGQGVLNTFHVSDENDLVSVETIMDIILDAYSDNWIGPTAPHYSVDKIGYRDLNVVGSSEQIYQPTGYPKLGLSTGEPVPTQACLLISWQGGATRPNRGRTYLPGLREGHVASNGIIISAVTDAAKQLADDILDNLQLIDPSVYLALRGHVPGDPTTEVRNQLFTSTVTNVPATQRRRRIGQGS